MRATGRKLLLRLFLLACQMTQLLGSRYQRYHILSDGYLCINDNYIEVYPGIRNEISCSLLCDQKPSCQALSLANGLCNLFVFNKCSKYVRKCDCSRTGRVLVKQRKGLEPGALCPVGYKNDLCGVKYKLLNESGRWAASRKGCEAEMGEMVIMADVIDDAEMAQIEALYTQYGIGSLWLGGYQRPGSQEPFGGWYWVDCNITLDPSLWGPGEPNNAKNTTNENAIGRFHLFPQLTDFNENSATPRGVVCECLSPFN